VVHEDVARAEDQRRPDHRPWQAGFTNDSFGARLTRVVGQRRVGRWVADTDVDHLADTGGGCCAHKPSCVRDRVAEPELPLRKPDPVRVVEHIDAAQTLDQHIAVVEPKGRDLDIHPFSAGPVRMIGERPPAPPGGWEPACDESSCETERSGYGIEVRRNQNGKRVKEYAGEPGLTCPRITTRGRSLTASAACTSGRMPLKI